jgi:hypothetical protein
MWILSLALVSLLALPAATAANSQLTLEAVREALVSKAAGKGAASAPIDLAGYGFHWEVGIGDDLEAVVISRNLAGSVLVFRPDGSLLASADTGEVTWLQLFDFDGDGTAELVTEEVEARGTGILVKQYHVYRVAGQGLSELWQGTAYSHKMLEESFETGSPTFEVVRGFLRFEPQGGGIPGPRLLHLVEVIRGKNEPRLARHAYLFEGASFREIPWPD